LEHAAGSRRATIGAVIDHLAHQVPVDFDGSIHVVEAGAGPPLVLIPGWTLDWTVFRRQIEVLSATRRVIAYDPRGQGRSKPTLDGNSFAQRGRDLERIVDALGVERFSLLGWSFGSYDAYAYIEQAGHERIDRLVVFDQPPRCRVDDLQTEWGDCTWESFAELAGRVIHDRATFLPVFADWIAAEHDTPDRAWLVEVMGATSAAMALAYLVDGLLCDFTALVERLDPLLPTLHVIRDEVAGVAAPWLATHAPRAEVAHTPSHLGFWSDADTFNGRLAAFLG
jgi:peroxiredoxin